MCVLQMGVYLWESLSDQRHRYWIFSDDKGQRFWNLQRQSHGRGRLCDPHAGIDGTGWGEQVPHRAVRSCCCALCLLVSGSFSLLRHHQNDHDGEPSAGILPRGELGMLLCGEPVQTVATTKITWLNEGAMMFKRNPTILHIQNCIKAIKH